MKATAIHKYGRSGAAPVQAPPAGTVPAAPHDNATDTTGVTDITGAPNANALHPTLPCGQFYRLIQWSDSMLPVGGFAFSCGLESAVHTGVVHDEATLQAYTLTALRQSAHSDAIALAHAHPMTLRGDWAGLTALDKAVYARKLAEEARAMSLRMGRKLLDLSADIFDDTADNTEVAGTHTAAVLPLLRRFGTGVREGATHGTWPVAQGIVLAAVGLDKAQALTAHQYGVAVTILNAALRLMRVTHVQTQRILHRLSGEVEAQCSAAAVASLGQMCAFAPMTDILGAVHVRAHVRLFMS